MAKESVMRIPRVAASVLLLMCLSAVNAESPASAAESLGSDLDKVDEVSFSFVARTGDYSGDADWLKYNASITIRRKCGANCRRFMRAVITHLEESAAAECPVGQQNVLIEIGQLDVLVYSYSGRAIAYRGECYFNPTGIENVIARANFIFN